MQLFSPNITIVHFDYQHIVPVLHTLTRKDPLRLGSDLKINIVILCGPRVLQGAATK